jgi:hypothetical protein
MKNSDIPKNKIKTKNNSKIFSCQNFFFKYKIYFEIAKNSSIKINLVKNPIKYKIIALKSVKFDSSLIYSTNECIKTFGNNNKQIFSSQNSSHYLLVASLQ